MKITLLLAQCTKKYLQQSMDTIIKVLEELDVNINKIDLHKLPYFDGRKTKEMDAIVKAIEESKGVIAISNVPMLSMHGAMQTFFDSATLYSNEAFNKPMLAVTYSDWLGEVEAAQKMLKSWNVLGGIESNKICFNSHIAFQEIEARLEREVEDFYRFIKQERVSIGCGERLLYNYLKEGNTLKAEIKQGEVNKAEDSPSTQIRSFVDILKSEKVEEETHINLSTKEQTIKEITSLLKKEVNEDEFMSISSGIYKRPSEGNKGKFLGKKIQQLPHYFIAQHDKSLDLTLKYHITDIDEEGVILIKDGDCQYKEQVEEIPSVEILLTEEVFSSIISKKMTYQKSFMLGKIKVKGNFSILPKLDQIFKAV